MVHDTATFACDDWIAFVVTIKHHIMVNIERWLIKLAVAFDSYPIESGNSLAVSCCSCGNISTRENSQRISIV